MTDQDRAAGNNAAGVEAPTRREFARCGVATTAAAALVATALPLADPEGALAAPASDGAVLVSLLRVEQLVVFAYERALAAGVMSASAQAMLASFLDQERAHVHALSVGVAGLGAAVPSPPSTTAAFESELRHLRITQSPVKPRSERQYVGFLIDLETVIARHYRFAIELLQGSSQLRTAAEIMANEAQHAAVLRELLSPGNVKRAVPGAFVAGIG